MKKKAIALEILERERVRQLVTCAVESPAAVEKSAWLGGTNLFTGDSVAGGGAAAPKPPQPVKPTTTQPVAKPIKPIAQLGQSTQPGALPLGRSQASQAQFQQMRAQRLQQNQPTPPKPSGNNSPSPLQAFGAGLRQGVGNMAGGIYNFGTGAATAAFHVPIAAAGILGQGVGRASDALGITQNAGAAADGFTGNALDSVWGGASDAVNSFGQYVGVRGAPTAVANLRAQNSANLPEGWQRTAYGLANNAVDMTGQMLTMPPLYKGVNMLTNAGGRAFTAATAALPNKVQPIARAVGNIANGYGQLTGLHGKRVVPVSIANHVVREGIVRPIDQAMGTNYADNDAIFPSRLLMPTKGTVANQPDLTPPTAEPQTGSEAGTGFSPEMERFLADNKIQTADDLGNLSEEQQAQFQSLWEQQQQKQQQQAQPAAIPDSVAAWGGGGAGPGGSANRDNQAQPQPEQRVNAPAPDAEPQPQPMQQVDSSQLEAAMRDPKATPEQKETARATYAKQWVEANKANMTEELKASAAAWQKDPKSPEAQLFAAQHEAAFNDLVQQQIDANPDATQNPDMFGQIMASATQMWENMGPMGQMALAVGVPLAMISMLGGSGLGLILGGLGLGFAGAAGGMFGADAQQMTQGFGQSAMSALGSMMGAPNPDEIKKQVAAISQLPPEQQKAEMEKIRAQVGPWAPWSSDAQKFMAVSGNNSLPNQQALEAGIIEAGKQGPEQAQAALADARKQVGPWAELSPNAQQFMAESGDKNYLYNKALQYGRDNYSELAAETSPWSASVFGKPEMKDADPSNRNWNEWWWGAPGSKQRDENIARRMRERGWVKQQSANIEHNLSGGRQKPAADMNIAQRILIKEAMRKAARCWAGYEPVPGTKAYTEGSCRPKGSKKTKKEVIQGKKHKAAK